MRLEEDESFYVDDDTNNNENFQHNRFQCSKKKKKITSDALCVKPSIPFSFLPFIFYSSDNFAWSEHEKKRTERQGEERSPASLLIVTSQLLFFFLVLSTGKEILCPLLAQLTTWTGGSLEKTHASWNCNSPSFFSSFLFSLHSFASSTSEKESLPYWRSSSLPFPLDWISENASIR